DQRDRSSDILSLDAKFRYLDERTGELKLFIEDAVATVDQLRKSSAGELHALGVRLSQEEREKQLGDVVCRIAAVANEQRLVDGRLGANLSGVEDRIAELRSVHK
ncbi:unnamed protein product, partial [Polarella glacialis]